jgi:N-hydroxyarylamine O-acetyltransferase
MVREGDLWLMHGTRDGASIPAWVSTLEIQYPVDFEMANHFIATHSSSRFVNGFLASAVTAEGRVNVMNRDVTVLRRGTVEKSILPDRSALRLLLVKHFGFDLPEAETMRVPSVPDWR